MTPETKKNLVGYITRYISDFTEDMLMSMIDKAHELEAGRHACILPPKGWYCTRERGHDGPCAAYPIGKPL